MLQTESIVFEIKCLNVFIANTKQGVGPQVFPTLVTALPLQYTYKALHRQWQKIFEPGHAISNNEVCATTKGSGQPAHTRSLIRALASRWLLHDCRATDEYHLKFLSSTEGHTGPSESTPLKMPHCWKSRVAAHFFKNKVKR